MSGDRLQKICPVPGPYRRLLKYPTEYTRANTHGRTYTHTQTQTHTNTHTQTHKCITRNRQTVHFASSPPEIGFMSNVAFRVSYYDAGANFHDAVRHFMTHGDL